MLAEGNKEMLSGKIEMFPEKNNVVMKNMIFCQEKRNVCPKKL